MAMRRVDVMMEEEMIEGADLVAQRRGTTRSGLIKGLVARELIDELGPNWHIRQPDDQQTE